MTLPRDPDALFQRARAELTPSTADEARVLAALTAKLGPPPPTGGGGGGGSGAGALSKIGAAVVIGGAIAIGVAKMLSAPAALPPIPSPSSSPPAPTSTVTASPAADSAPVMAVDDLPSAKPSSPMPPARASAAPPSSSESGDSLAAELRLVERMHAAEQRGDLVTVLALASEHERTFPRGALLEEREASRAAATCKTDAASRSRMLSGFRARFPRSSHDARVRVACSSDTLSP